MRQIAAAVALAAMGLVAGPADAADDPLPEIIRELIEQAPEQGDHMVGEELCSQPGAVVPHGDADRAWAPAQFR